MKNFLKVVLYFILSIIVLGIFYSFVYIPIVPIYALYLFTNLSLKNCNCIKTIIFF